MENRPTLALSALLIGSLLLGMSFYSLKPASASVEGSVDVYTQKEINNGIGPDNPSDAFSPGDIVQLNAFVSYREFAVSGVLVSFQVSGPPDSTQNIVFSQGSTTDQWGIASFSFRVPYQEQISIGEWSVVSNAKIGDSIVTDSLRFKVGWIVEIVSVETLDQDGMQKDSFSPSQTMVVKVGVLGISMQQTTVTFAVTMIDGQDVVINSTQADNLIVPPNETLTDFAFFLQISDGASTGLARVCINALSGSISSGGIPYCPEICRSFYITVHDLALVNVVANPRSVEQGETVYIDVTIKNQGSELESCTAIVYYDSMIIGTQNASDLNPLLSETLHYTWNTASVTPGQYSILVVVEALSSDINMSNNSYDGGQVEVKTRSSSQFHDIAVLNLVPSGTYIITGETLEVEVTVSNKGDYPESFVVKTYCGSSIIGTMPVENMMPRTTKVLLFEWIVTGLTQGNYTLKAEASIVSGEVNIDNNILRADNVQVASASRNPESLEIFLLIAAVFLVIFGLLLILLVSSRKRKNTRVRKSFNSGWVSWFYGYDLLHQKPYSNEPLRIH